MDIINRLDKSIISDPRTISAGHSGQRMVFSEPALSGKVCLNDVKTGFYRDHSDIRAGYITYYVDRQIMKPFVSQIFAPTLAVEFEDYVDANGIPKPHYKRLAGLERQPCLSFISDTQRSRDDLVASNMWRRNQQNGFVGI